MKKTTRRSIGALLTLLLLFTGMISVYAMDQSDVVTLSEIKTMTETDNITLARLMDDWEQAKIALDTAEEVAGDIGGSELAWWKSQSYDIMAAELAVEKASWAIVEKTSSLEQEGVNLYYDLLLLEEEINLQTLEVTDRQRTFDEATEKYQMGLETQLNVDTARVDLMIEETEKVGLTYDYESLQLDLNQLINKDLDTRYTLAEAALPDVEIPEALTDKDINLAIENNMDLIFMYRDLELLEEIKMIYHDLNDEDVYDNALATTMLSIEEQNLLIDDQILSIEIELLTAYNSLLNAADDMTIAELSLESLGIDLMYAQEQLAMGMVSQSYVDAIERSMLAEELSIKQAQLDLYNELMGYNLLLER